MNRCEFKRLMLICVFFVSIQSMIHASGNIVRKVEVEVQQDNTAYVSISGRKTIHLRTRNVNLSPAERAEIVRDRLSEHLQRGLDPDKISSRQSGQNYHIMVGNALLLVATRDEARSRNMTTKQVADMWVRNLKKVLTLPPLHVEPKSLLVPLDETRSITVESLLPEIKVEVANPLVASADDKTKPGAIIVTGLSVGATLIEIISGKYSETVEVFVKKYAASVMPGVKRAVVTGSNATAPLIAQAARETAAQFVELEPGVKISDIRLESEINELRPGVMRKASVIAEAEGGDHIPAKLIIPVDVENRSIRRNPTSWIMYSNHPESVRRYQLLFAGLLESNDCSYRLLYHHQNRMNQRIGFVIDVVNYSNQPAELHVIESISRAMLDTVIIGYVAGVDFIENHRSFAGRVIEIQPGTRRVIVTQTLESPHSASGIIEFQQTKGDPLMVRVIAKPDSQRRLEDPLDIPLSSQGVNPSNVSLSDQIYPNPERKIEVTYTAGKQWVFLRLGREHLRHATEDLLLYGNYGVIYDIRARLENPTNTQLNVEVVLEATAGPASGVFLVDGVLHRVRYLAAKGEGRVATIRLAPGENRIVNIRTIPLSGSAYPANLTIRPIGTTATMQ